MPLIIASGDYSFQWGHDLPVMDTVFATAKAPLQVYLSYLTIDVVSRFVTTSLTSAKFAQNCERSCGRAPPPERSQLHTRPDNTTPTAGSPSSSV